MAGFPTHSTGFSDALVILGAAGIVIPAFARVRVNPVIGFILVGLALGPHGLGVLVPRWPWLFYVTITDPHAIEPYAEFGIILLLFRSDSNCRSAGYGRCGGRCSASVRRNSCYARPRSAGR